MLLHQFTIRHGEQGQTLAAILRTRLNLSWSHARKLVEQRQIRVNEATTVDPVRRMKIGMRIQVHGQDITPSRAKPVPQPKPVSAPKERKKPDRPAPYDGPKPKLVYVDDAIVIAEKPPGLTTMRHAEEAAEFGERGRKFLPRTMADLLPGMIGASGQKRAVRAVHRIDRDTSGLVVFARTPQAETHLTAQFRKHSIDRIYLALVRGEATSGRIESHLVKDRGDGRRGSGSAEEGQHAVTHVKVRESLGAYTLVECRLETGRTHQVRIHLGEQGTPLCGERIYDRPLNGSPYPDESGCPRTFLHAARLGLEHPETGQRMQWESPLPDDLEAVLQRIRTTAEAVS